MRLEQLFYVCHVKVMMLQNTLVYSEVDFVK
ncbi:hypothetical protein J2W91_001831 [Paenibacillus amylolyticus]|uniref:Uncharacterized protein n=1 Tax=Paenibacillus amylolyticus TaxID=1451 RepID=A0AAP5LQD7_PAEAM|nr:hypothetical protein [Paenibacillus amylolyticus]